MEDKYVICRFINNGPDEEYLVTDWWTQDIDRAYLWRTMGLPIKKGEFVRRVRLKRVACEIVKHGQVG